VDGIWNRRGVWLQRRIVCAGCAAGFADKTDNHGWTRMNTDGKLGNIQTVGRITSAFVWLRRDKPCAPFLDFGATMAFFVVGFLPPLRGLEFF
jgi:hypothetical protein